MDTCAKMGWWFGSPETPAATKLPGPVEELRKELQGGDLFLFGEPGYEDARMKGPPVDGAPKQTKTWNLDAANYPSAIVRPVKVQHVAAAVKYANEHCLPENIYISVAGGRHSHQCLVANSFCIDMSRMRSVTVDKAALTAVVECGALMADLDAATLPHNLAVTLGLVGSTGIGGLIPHGGHGYLERTSGLTVDSLLEATIVTADGQIRTCSSSENPNLFWAIRGAGANFGVLTEFKFQLHQLEETYFGGQRIHLPLGFGWWPNRKDLIMNWVAGQKGKGDQVKATGNMVCLKSPPLVIETVLWLGKDKEEGKQHFEEVLKVGAPVSNSVSDKTTYATMQSLAPDDAVKCYMFGAVMGDIDEKVADAVHTAIQNAPTGQCHTIIQPIGGKGGENTAEDLPVHRQGRFWILIMAIWSNASDRSACVEWAKNLRSELGQLQPMTAYGAMAGNDGDAWCNEHGGKSYYGRHYAKLQTIKQIHDPKNLFRFNANITP